MMQTAAARGQAPGIVSRVLLPDVLSFAVVAGLVTIVPGLDTAMVLRSAISRGRRHGFAVKLGLSSR